MDLYVNVYWIIIGNTLIIPGEFYFNSSYLIKHFQRKKISDPKKNFKLTQYQANQIYEYPSFCIDYNYARINLIYMTTMFYGTM